LMIIVNKIKATISQVSRFYFREVSKRKKIAEKACSRDCSKVEENNIRNVTKSLLRILISLTLLSACCEYFCTNEYPFKT